MFDHKKKHAEKQKKERVDKKGRLRHPLFGFTGFTFARPGTQEYKRFLIKPQYPTHIKEIHKYLDLRQKFGTEHKSVRVK